MGQSWFYSHGTNQFGPVTLDELKRLIQSGQVQLDNLVWSEGMAQWMAAGSIPQLAESSVQAPPMSAPNWPGQAPIHPGVLGYQGFAYGSQQQAYGGFWLRFCAAIVDGIIMAIAGGIVGFVIGAMAGANGIRPNTPQWLPVAAAIQIVGIVMNWLYYASMESSSAQATLGKMAVGVKVTDDSGARIGFGRATGRYFGKIVSALILLVGYMMAGWTEKKQALHDMMAGTLVVKSRP